MISKMHDLLTKNDHAKNIDRAGDVFKKETGKDPRKMTVDEIKKYMKACEKTAAFTAGVIGGIKTAKTEVSKGRKFVDGFGPEALIGVSGAMGAGLGNVLAGKPVEGAAIASGLAGAGSILHGVLTKKRKKKK